MPPVFANGLEYSDLVGLVELCVRRDVEREKLAPVTPDAFLDYLRSINLCLHHSGDPA